MSIDKGFPQPTTEELEAEAIYYLKFNPFWFKIAQGKLGEVAKKELWDSYTEEIDQGAIAMTRRVELPTQWVHTADFREVDDGWVLQGSRGVWVAGSGWSQTSQGSQRGVEIERTIDSADIRGILVNVTVNSNTSNRVYVALENPQTIIYDNVAQANVTFKDIRIDGDWKGITKIKIGALNPGLIGSYVIRHVVVWGVGEYPF